MLNSSRKFLRTNPASSLMSGSGSNITSASPIMKSAALILSGALSRGSYLEVPKFSSVPEAFYNNLFVKRLFHTSTICKASRVSPAKLARLEYEAQTSNNMDRKAEYLQALFDLEHYQMVVQLVDSGSYSLDHPLIRQIYRTSLERIGGVYQENVPRTNYYSYSQSQQQQQSPPTFTSPPQDNSYIHTFNFPHQPQPVMLPQKLVVTMDDSFFTRFNRVNVTRSFISLLFSLAIVGLFFYLAYYTPNDPTKQKQGGGGLGSMFGQTSYKPITNVETRFNDVKGIDECRGELEEIVDFLKNPEKFNKLGGKLPKGVLLVGKPGVGKTLLAKAIAGEAGVPFFFCSGSEFDEMFVGVGARRIRELFAAARKQAPCIIFIDEIDSLGGKRTAKDPFYSKQTLNQILSEMDGFKSSEGIIVIGATNLLESLDKALIRPGRFDRHIEVPLPDLKGRKEILDLYLKKVPLNPTVNVETIAKKTTGFTGADLENLVNVASIRACTKNKEQISGDDIDYAFDRIVMGIARTSSINVMNEKDKEITAIHECGHALVVLLNQKKSSQLNKDILHKLTIIPRGSALGFTASLPEREVHHMSKQQYLQIIEKALGGVVAEEIIYGKDNVTSGCTSDLQHATNVARSMVTRFGMSELGLIDFTEESSMYQKGPEFSPETKRLIDIEIQKIVNSSYERVRAMLKENESELRKLAKELVKYETLSGKEVLDILEGREVKRSIVGEVDF
ncbi:hypothetical protein C9374_001315 [Naegleria lovaniensis]|uniref:AAA+ ATPase domain-containing protein n=1 Tax=Naegleria lovaniensis TaxID=51637 RepID=A0AA88GST4_NAELO|nr:uncharacterized protein C9374_001315 [Naegleria lovaniensis]KAG2387721.1 hypothetical protein C9374_001315 [Naegleria lovaniensis]